ncbi:uncharacterized protein m [Anabrus simplex]|uniref:uncharacterized protein m n=1 Tax=Anabrus simplex TaxID=316456 RepID=UPI0035A2AA17
MKPWRCWTLLACLLTAAAGVSAGSGDIWPLERPEGMPAIQSLEVMCGKDHMDVHLSFTHPFEGIVSSKGQYADPRCVYVQPSTGKMAFSFRIAYARCGTKPDLHGQFYENTVVVQYDKDLLEVWDEAKRLRCEWFNDYEKTASKPPMVIADLDVIQLDFRGDNVDCWMEIQHGKGPWAPPVSGIVPLGSTLTLVVAINDYRGEFDMRVKSCTASDGGVHVIQLSDEHGCVLRPKMISRFLKARAADERASVITYAFFHAFKFPDALSVHIKCKVEICRHGCLDHCQLGSPHPYGPLERKDPQPPPPSPTDDMLIYDELVTDGDDGVSQGSFPVVVSSDDPVPPSAQAHTQSHHRQPPSPQYSHDFEMDDKDILTRPFQEQPRPGHRDGQDRFPHGPRNLDVDDIPLLKTASSSTSSNTTPPPSIPTPRSNRRRRSVVVSDRKVRSADVGVSGLYEVISEVDLAFTPDMRAEAVTVFQGRIREEVVYGICLPVPGFSALFVLVAVSAVMSALVAGCLLYRYQLQRETLAAQQQAQQVQRGAPPPQSITGWMALRLLRARPQASQTSTAQTISSASQNNHTSER